MRIRCSFRRPGRDGWHRGYVLTFNSLGTGFSDISTYAIIKPDDAQVVEVVHISEVFIDADDHEDMTF